MKIAIKGEEIEGDRPDMTLELRRGERGEIELVGWIKEDYPDLVQPFYILEIEEDGGIIMYGDMPDCWNPVGTENTLDVRVI